MTRKRLWLALGALSALGLALILVLVVGRSSKVVHEGADDLALPQETGFRTGKENAATDHGGSRMIDGVPVGAYPEVHPPFDLGGVDTRWLI